MFKDYNNFLIPYEVIDNKKVLILNSVHASLTTDQQFFDECLKITYDFKNNEFRIRTVDMTRQKMELPMLEKFLLEEIKKYEMPVVDEDLLNIDNLNAVVVDYSLPLKKMIKSDFEANKKFTETLLKEFEVMGVKEKALHFVQKKLNRIVSNIPNNLGNNLSEYSRWLMTISVAKDVARFVKNEDIKKCIIHETDGEYWIDIELERLFVDDNKIM